LFHFIHLSAAFTEAMRQTIRIAFAACVDSRDYGISYTFGIKFRQLFS